VADVFREAVFIRVLGNLLFYTPCNWIRRYDHFGKKIRYFI